MEIVIKTFEQLTKNELYDILSLRAEVFVVEQKCSYLDLDYKDLNSIHFFIKEDDKIVSYIRVIPPGISYKHSASIGRVLTKKSYRGRGLSRKLIESGINYIKNNFTDKTIEISAQEYLIEFYKSFGFIPEGDLYLEDNLPHMHMILNL